MTRWVPGNTPRPPVYVVGSQRAQRPLVSLEHVKGHIRLLRSFYNLRITVEDCKDRRIPGYAMKIDKAARWRWFVHLAVERYVLPSSSSSLAAPSHPLCAHSNVTTKPSRFERWVQSLQLVPLEKFVTEHIPPVDVWMVWHAYLLSPW